jgi:hypothetical protein
MNEYRTLTNVAEKLSIGIQTYKELYGQAITGYSPEREKESGFIREYINYRLLDETTRLKNGNRLFREFSERLNNARSADELRQIVKVIRQENYGRDKFPERYKKENDEIRFKGEQPRSPLNEIELKKLFLSQTPAHYTPEMREARFNYALTSREKADRLKALETGTIKPSLQLQTLLTEFE